MFSGHCFASEAVVEKEDSQDKQPEWIRLVFKRDNWSAHFQATYVWQEHPGFPAAYDGPHSLASHKETGYTLTSTLFLGHRLWKGAEIFANPEIIQSIEFSDLHGLGGLTNGENQKTGGPTVSIYSARAFLRQTIGLGGKSLPVEDGPNQFGGEVQSRRFVLTVGQMALTDIFDNNSFAHDSRTQFFNWALLAYGASDYAADARGYTVGAALEYYHDNWVFRFGHFAQPKESNGLALDYRLWVHFGDNLEVEHNHAVWGHAGKLRAMGFLNYANMGGFRDALNNASGSGGTPDVATVRRDRAKLGFGISLEQNVTTDLGCFGRFSRNDGRTETFAFAEIDQSLTLGCVMKGKPWYRPNDTLGLAFVQNGLSAAHRDYLSTGGLGNFIGDGRINYVPERILDTYYSFRAFKGVWLSAGFQHIWNPAYNADRGPVRVVSARVHFEY
ncbi:MAG: carbohydrate porin [Deltaproteobacteria bacterium]|nr:carbohydrate porin [Deltaproteobacteria bacterium]